MLKDVPPIVHGKHNGRQVAFERGRFLGKGGFARCYELIDKTRNITYAGKVISKTILIKKSQRDKVMQEVMIHSSLKHPHIVRLDGHFEDADNVFVLLELCARRSLMELHKRRRVVTEPEARYFTHHVVSGCQYLHGLKIIHRDLKLGNLFINDDMQLKIGDFGLATKVEFDGQQKQTLCGTPNYIAPEMLLKMGHSYGVDVWAIGCILYTLLVGKPPFETESLKQTYSKIRKNEYVIPTRIGQHAHEMIAALLAPQPEARPTVFDIPKFKFFSRGFLPEALPVSCLVSVPRFNQENLSGGMIEPETRLGNVARSVPSSRQQPHVVQDAASMIVTLLKYFRSYMMKHLLSAGEKLPRRGQEFARFPCLSAWFRTNSAIVLMMTDGTLQLNFFADHTKIIICPSMQAVTFIDPNRVPHTYRLQHLVESGCSHELRKRLKYAKTMVDRMLSRGNNAALCHSNTES
ncbi:Serine/threonine-protein kinase PLK [Aphelenchoides fujianensis]|nr:Serine/threonine-protein kinase PLK [Aphelenchoides fujianensis]